MAKDSAFIPTLKDGDFPLRPSQSYELKAVLIISPFMRQEKLNNFPDDEWV